MIDFPASPTVGQQFTVAGVTWTWDGTKWTIGAGTSGLFLPLAGGTLTGNLNAPSIIGGTLQSQNTLSVSGEAYMYGRIYPISSLGIFGTWAGDNVEAGSVGEVISSVVPSPGVSLTNGVSANVTSISLTAGDWDVQGEVWLVPSGVCTGIVAGMTTNSGVIPGSPVIGGARNQIIAAMSASTQVLPVRTCRVNVTATTPYYLTAQGNFTSGTCTAYGIIWARRAR